MNNNMVYNYAPFCGLASPTYVCTVLLYLTATLLQSQELGSIFVWLRSA